MAGEWQTPDMKVSAASAAVSGCFKTEDGLAEVLRASDIDLTASYSPGSLQISGELSRIRALLEA